jgi:hypothetical protein
MAAPPYPLHWTRLLMKGVRLRLQRLSARRAVVLMASLFLLLLAAGDGILLWLEYDRVLDENTQDAANLTVTLEQHVRQKLEQFDRLLLNLIHVDGATPNPFRPGSPYAFIFRRTDQVQGLRIYDRDGRLRSADRPVGRQGKDWSQAEPFLFHSSRSDSVLLVGKPFLEDGIWRYPLSRRIAGAHAEFGGIAVVLADMGAFAQFFRSISVGTHGSIAIIRRDGQVITRHPPILSALGVSVADSPIFRLQIAPLAEGMVRGVSALDGYERIGHFR